MIYTLTHPYNFFALIAHTVAQELQAGLCHVATEPGDSGWTDHLYEICRTAARVKQKTLSHTEVWSFGSWDDAMLFPEVIANGRQMMRPTYN